jgi:hypothetical protein
MAAPSIAREAVAMSAQRVRFLGTLLVISVGASFAVAATRPFPFPAAAPVATIDVPEDWGPRATSDGVEGSTNNGAVRLNAQFIPAPDPDSAFAAAMASIRRQGVSPTLQSRRSWRQRYNGLDALKVSFSGTDPNGESEITMILVTLPGNAGFVAVSYWGDDEAQESVGNDLQAIAESIKLSN